MAVGAGLSASLGIATETTVGTPVAVTRFIEFDSESVALKKNMTQGAGLRQGGLVARAARRVNTGRSVGGDLELQCHDERVRCRPPAHARRSRRRRHRSVVACTSRSTTWARCRAVVSRRRSCVRHDRADAERVHVPVQDHRLGGRGRAERAGQGSSRSTRWMRRTRRTGSRRRRCSR